MQYYLSGLVGFLVIEMVANWGEWWYLLLHSFCFKGSSILQVSQCTRKEYGISRFPFCRSVHITPNSISTRWSPSAVAILDAGRNALSFFMLLVVSLGLSVVRESLGKTMLKCQLLAGAHFVFGGMLSCSSQLFYSCRSKYYMLLVSLNLSWSQRRRWSSFCSSYLWRLRSVVSSCGSYILSTVRCTLVWPLG